MGKKFFLGPTALLDDVFKWFGHYEKLASDPATRPGGLPVPKFLPHLHATTRCWSLCVDEFSVFTGDLCSDQSQAGLR